MIQVSQAFNDAIAQSSRQFEAKILKGSQEIQCDIKSLSIYKGACVEEYPIGTLFSSYIEIVADGVQGLNNGDKVTIHIGVVTANSVEWAKIGHYTISGYKATTRTATFSAIGVIATDLGKPFTPPAVCSIANTIGAISSTCGVSIQTSLNTSEVVEASMQGLTCREALEVITSVLGGYATEDNNGNIHIKTYKGAVPINLDNEGVAQEPEISGSEIDVTGVKVIVTEEGETEDGGTIDEVSYTYGTPRIVFSNPYMTQALFNQFVPNVVGLKYTPATVNIALGNPCFEAQDVLLVTDENNAQHVIPCMSIIHRFDGGISTEVIAYGNDEVEEDSNIKGVISRQVERINARLLTAEEAIINRLTADEANLDYARIDRTNINEAWVKNLLVQGEIIAQAGTVYELDAIQVNASKIKAGTIDVERLIMTVEGEKYLVHFDLNGTPIYEKLDGNIIEDNTITADKIVANSITVNELTVNDIVGTNGWINLAQGQFNYTDPNTGAGITWLNKKLNIKAESVIIGSLNVGNAVTLLQQGVIVDTTIPSVRVQAGAGAVDIKSDRVEIEEQGMTTASFQKDEINLGKTAKSSSIKMCGETCEINTLELLSPSIYNSQYASAIPFLVEGDYFLISDSEWNTGWEVSSVHTCQTNKFNTPQNWNIGKNLYFSLKNEDTLLIKFVILETLSIPTFTNGVTTVNAKVVAVTLPNSLLSVRKITSNNDLYQKLRIANRASRSTNKLIDGVDYYNTYSSINEQQVDLNADSANGSIVNSVKIHSASAEQLYSSSIYGLASATKEGESTNYGYAGLISRFFDIKNNITKSTLIGVSTRENSSTFFLDAEKINSNVLSPENRTLSLYYTINCGTTSGNSYSSGTRTITRAGYYPLGVVGFYSNRSNMLPYKVYLTDRSNGSATIVWGVSNKSSSSQTSTLRVYVLWEQVTSY